MYICIAGPTASGKSEFALRVAKEVDGIIINTDSMQVYKELPILTAQPFADMYDNRHFLYGHVSVYTHYSVAQWLNEVANLLSNKALRYKKKIFVGGSGLYFLSLFNGLSYIPEVSKQTEKKIDDLVEEYQLKQLSIHDILLKYDEPVAAQLHKNDTKRIRRALGVFLQTGYSLRFWQNQKKTAIIPPNEAKLCFFLNPDRALLYQKINDRVDHMLQNGVIEEVKHVMEQKIAYNATARQVLGFNYLYAYCNKQKELDEIRYLIQRDVRRYAKRQWSWAKRYMQEWQNLTEEVYRETQIIDHITKNCED